MSELIDLSRLTAPAVVEALDYEDILAQMLADLQARDATFTALLESDPAYKILEVCAYREMLVRQRVNDAARGVMLAYAVGSDLDQIAANYGVARLLIAPADTQDVPPIAAIYEADADLRRRVLLSLEGYTTAGSVGSYTFHALSADGDCKDVGIASLTPGHVNVAVLSRTGDGAAPQQTLDAVTAALSAETVRPLCDTVEVESAQIITYSVLASLTVYPGTSQQQALDAATAQITAYTAEMHRLGRDVTRSGIFAALHQPGVQNVSLTTPAADVVVQWNQAAYCTTIDISIGGIDE